MKSTAALLLMLMSAVPRAAQSDAIDWTRIVKLTPGTEVQIGVSNKPVETRWLLRATESEIIVLNVSALPADYRRAVREFAALHPEYFLASGRSREFQLESGLIVRRDGVFQRDRHLADIDQLVERIARADVTALTRPAGMSKTRKIFIGASIGVGAFFGLGAALCCRDD